MDLFILLDIECFKNGFKVFNILNGFKWVYMEFNGFIYLNGYWENLGKYINFVNFFVIMSMFICNHCIC